ncbi:hypothetical protein CAL7716_043720 [Calothrix sp. PCC 7716]|nr:hypothetical protein CAL7716_043720 [Calothrix sp. PCC 7716]
MNKAMVNKMIVENFDLNNALKFCVFLQSHPFGNKLNNHYVRMLAYHIRQCRKYHQNKLVIGLQEEEYNHLVEILDSLDKTLMAEVEKDVQGSWNQMLSELGVNK